MQLPKSVSNGHPCSGHFLVLHIEVQHHELGLLGAVAAAHGAHQLGVVAAQSPHHPTAAPAVQRHQVSQELPCLQVPDLDRAVVRGSDDKLLAELQARDSALVLVWA